jgi:polysaccharide biosynthesis transport protein
VQQGPEALNLEQALAVLRRRVPLIALCIVVVAGATYAFSKHQTKKYTATASLAFTYNQLSQQVAGLPPSSSTNLLAQEASNLELVKLGDMAAKTASILGRGLTQQKVAGSLSISGQGESSIVSVSATNASPALAAAMANTYVQQFVKEQQTANHQYFKSALALVHKELARLTPVQRLGQDGLALQQRAQSLGILAELKYGNVQVAQEALAPTSPSSPRTSRNTGLGALLGLIIGLGLAFVLERLDRRVREPSDLESIYGLPMLGSVPESAALARPQRHGGAGARALPSVETEAFNLIRAHLRFFNVDNDVRTLVVASASPGDGKTTIARHLAEAAARMGSRVLLVEADLRQPTLAQHLSINPAPGLTDVLIGAIGMGDAIQSIDLDEIPMGRTLDVLVSGAAAPNPGELVESRAMASLLEQAATRYDLTVIDTPPLTSVSDAFPLLTKVDGVVIVGWVGHSRRDAAQRLHQVLASSGAPVLGVIANGTSSGGPGPYTDKPSAPIASSNGASPSQELKSTVTT